MLTKWEKLKSNRPMSMRNRKIVQLSIKSVLKGGEINGGKDLWKRNKVLSLEWKSAGVMDGERNEEMRWHLKEVKKKWMAEEMNPEVDSKDVWCVTESRGVYPPRHTTQSPPIVEPTFNVEPFHVKLSQAGPLFPTQMNLSTQLLKCYLYSTRHTRICVLF